MSEEIEQREAELLAQLRAELEKVEQELATVPDQVGQGTLAAKVKRLVDAYRCVAEDFRVTNAALVKYDNERRAAVERLQQYEAEAANQSAIERVRGKEDITRILSEHGINRSVDSNLHSWRCGYPDRYGACDCLELLVRSLSGEKLE